MTSKLYLDSETCGLHSMMVLLQTAVEDGPIELHDIWLRPIRETLNRIEKICEHTVVGFNLVFDWFHIVKVYTIFRLANPDWIPIEHINELALLEPAAQDGPCVKPAGALDLLLHSRKGPYQSLMAREDVRIRRVPAVLAYALAGELENRVQLDGIYFAKSKDKDAPRWQVRDRKNRDGEIDREFKDVVLRFNPAGGLKFLAEHAMGFKPKFHYSNVEPDRQYLPIELGYAPTALAVSTPEKDWTVWKKNSKGESILSGYAWPGVIQHFVKHWAENHEAREYATDDIVYTRALDKHFGCPEPNDDDSILACMVPVVRWHGFTINVEGMKELLAKAEAVIATSPININRPPEVRAYIAECMDETEFQIIEASTNKKALEKVAKVTVKTAAEIASAVEHDEEDEVLGTDGIENLGPITHHEHCMKCDGTGRKLGTEDKCLRCNGKGHLEPGPHPAALRAQEILAVKFATKEKELYSKLIHAKKFHAAFDVIGALSSRMSGRGGGLNPQGIKRAKEVRRMFPLAWGDFELCGGDFDSFEVTLADAVYNDPTLREDLMSGKKIHALFAMSLYPGVTYEDVINQATEEMYNRGKTAIFGMIYGGDWSTMVRNLSIAEDVAKAAESSFNKRYPGVAKARQRTFKAFCSMTQPAGAGSAVVWADPAEFIETFLGFRRYFTLENKICKALFDLARKPPKAWRDTKDIKVMRSKTRVQTACGAVASALYGAAFGMQAMNMRAAANHEIQSPGGQITKAAQRAIWDIQPAGVHELLVAPMNVHDELMVSTHKSVVTQVTDAVRNVVESFRSRVPLIGMSWFESMQNWAEKKDGAEKVKIRCAEMMKFK